MSGYGTIVADPPWPFRWGGGKGGRRRNETALGYGLMSVDEIVALPVRELRAESCVLMLWVTTEAHESGDALRVMRAWGFERSGSLVWRKPNFGAGAWPRIGHETCLIGVHGRPLVDAPRDVHSVQTWRQVYDSANGKRHSAKPDGFYDLVERDLPGPRLELFARRARFGWDYWGDESLQTVELGAACRS